MLFILSLCAGVSRAQVADDIAARERAVDYFYLQAVSLLEQDSVDACFEMLEHCRALAPESSAVLYELSPFYLFLGKDSIAHSMLEYIVAKEPDNVKYGEALINYYAKVDDRRAAIALYERMLKASDASKSDIYMSLYSLYSEEGEFGKAVEVLDKLEKVEGKNEIISIHRANLFLQMQDSVRALAAVREMKRDFPHNIQYNSLLGDVYVIFGDVESAEKVYIDAIQGDSTDTYSLSSLSNLYLLTNRDSLYCESVERLLKSEKVDTEQRISTLFEYVGYKEKTDTAYSMRFLQELMQLPYDRLEVSEVYAQYLLYRKESPEVIKPVLDSIISMDPENRSAMLQLLVYAIESDNREEVITRCDNAILYIPDMLELYYYKGMATYLLERKEEATEILQQGLGRRNEECSTELISTVFSLMGEIYHELDDLDRCTQAYDSALLYNPSDISVLNNYAYYLALEGKELERALEMSARTIEMEPDNAIYVDTYAWLLFCLERYEEARAYADKLIGLNSEMSAVEYHHCGDIFSKCGDMQRAVECWMAAQRLGDDSRVLKKKIKRRKYYPNAHGK
ncbi:MAG: hypothetical protein IKY47_01675 [Bacteroidaceae bacterium]|nr:hypothetical protein [Bacteroidaceae bacterium]